MTEQDFLHKSLRIRYEAFSSFATAISSATSPEAIAQLMSVHAKYIIDVFIIRFYYAFAGTEQVLEIFRGNGQWKAADPTSPLHLLEQQVLANNIPRFVQGAAIRELAQLKGSIFDHERVKSIYTLPLSLSDTHKLVISVASKVSVPYSDPDFRFIRLLAESLSNKLSQLLLLQKIEQKNTELAEVNDELTTLNEEIKRLNLYLEDKVEERTAALQTANDELNTIFYRASHDFRRPLTTILGLANVARHTTADDQVLKLFGYVEEAVGDLSRMLEKLKDLSFFADNQAVFGPCDFDAIMAQIRQHYAQLIVEKKAEIRLKTTLKSPFYAPDGLLYAILENLIENSLLFSSEAPLIQVEIYPMEDKLQIVVRDNGQGIRPEFLSRVMDMYVRAHEHTKGNGLGLYVVKKLAEKLEGSVAITSVPGEGTTVNISLPLVSRSL